MISPSLGLRSPARYPHLLLKCQRKTIPGEMSESGTPAALRCTAQCIPQLTKLREELKSCAKCCAAAGAMELATLREELKLRKMLRYCRRNGTQQSKVFGPYFALRALLSYLAAHCDESRSLVDCKKRPKFRLSLPCRPATDSAALLFHRAAFATKCNDTALARASSLPASWLTAWVLWTGFFFALLRGKCPY